VAKESKLSNYIPINRQLFHHSFWKEDRPFSRFEAWLDLIRTARFEITEARELIDGKMVKWNRGELPASLRYLAERWKWSKNKVDSFLKLLENEQMIVKRTAEGTGKTIISLCNYESYNVNGKIEGQQKGQSRDSDGTATGQGRDESNKDNNINKEEDIPGKPEYSKEEKEMFDSFVGWLGKYAPRVSKLKSPFTIDEYLKVKRKIPKEQLKSLLLKMHNWGPLLKNNHSAYLTILNWYERVDDIKTKADGSTEVQHQILEKQKASERAREILERD
jgi:hypothetical protein